METEKDYKKIARQVLKTAGQSAPPTNLERVLTALRLFHERPWHLATDVWEGLSRPSRGRTRFKSQERAATARQRWRVAHEIAHHVLHGAVPHLRAGSWDSHELEYEADLLAAELLIPDPWIKRALKSHTDEHRQVDVEGLAAEFAVGRQEMEKRLKQLGLLEGEVFLRM